MRTAIALAACLLAAACSSGASEERAATPAAGDTSTASSAPSHLDRSFDPCDLLTKAQMEELAGDAVGMARAGMTGGLPTCRWTTADGRFVQAIGATAPEWARSLPGALRAIEASGEFEGADALVKLRDGAALIEAGQDLGPAKACSLFSEMVELQGRPPGTPWIVTVVPTKEAPQAVTRQICSGGRFTSVMVGTEPGLAEPLPIRPVAQAVQSAHRRSLR